MRKNLKRIFSRLDKYFKNKKLIIKKKLIVLKIYEREYNVKINVIKKFVIIILYDIETLTYFFENVIKRR